MIEISGALVVVAVVVALAFGIGYTEVSLIVWLASKGPAVLVGGILANIVAWFFVAVIVGVALEE